MKQCLPRILAIDPTTRGFAYAVLEGEDRLIDWGTVHAKDRTLSQLTGRVERLLAQMLPDTIVVEDGRGSRRGRRAWKLIEGIEALSDGRGLPVRRVSRAKVRQALRPATTKQEIADAVASSFPELAPRLPRVRKPWMSEAERMSIFDAVSFCLAALHEER